MLSRRSLTAFLRFTMNDWRARVLVVLVFAAFCIGSVLMTETLPSTEANSPHDNEKQRRDLLIADVLAKINHEIQPPQSPSQKTFPKVAYLPADKRRRILVTGGAGFVGSHLVDRLMLQGHEVTVADNFFTGRRRNVEHWIGHSNFDLINHDVTLPLHLQVDEIYHLASPASPPHYMLNPIYTMKTNLLGTLNMLGLARRVNAKFLLTSTSEVYGDPKEHPQKESYWGNVNTLGPRSCYDEGKRAAETLCLAYNTQEQVDVRIARIFNTFGPRMHPNDGRVVSNFIIQSLKNEDISIYGSGLQTRSFQYVDDLVAGLMALMASGPNMTCMPANLGNPDEYTILNFAEFIKKEVGNNNKIINLPAQRDDPQQRKPDISRAKSYLNWQPVVPVLDGVKETIAYFKQELEGKPYIGVWPSLREKQTVNDA